MSYWDTAQQDLESSSQLRRELSETERQRLGVQLQDLGTIYNIPGITRDIPVVGLQSSHGRNFATMSTVGGNIRSLEVNNRAIYSYGADPFVVPILVRDAQGQIQWQISSPAYYRNLGHTATPTVNEFTEIDNSVIEELESITGQQIPLDFNTGHHGASQCLVAPINISKNGYAAHYTTHQPDRTNLFPYEREVISGFDKKGRFVESIRLGNPNNFPIPMSMLRHPYFYVTDADFAQGEILYVRSDDNVIAYKLNEYWTVGETEFKLPLLINGEYIQFMRADGTKVNIGFAGDYLDQDSRVQIFSSGSNNKTAIRDFEDKYQIMQERLARLADLQHSLGLDDSWIDHADIIGSVEIITEMMDSVHMCGFAIEDGVASGGNIYDNLEALKKARIIDPGQILTFTRYTWVE